MTFIWTAPDPLNNTAKTRSIYITELQDAVNVKRAEIGLAPITFIDQRVGKKFRLDAIEELKTVINDLAILYGYSTGVEDSSLLGRPYVTITKKYGKYVCHYPIINDLRIVLEAMVVQEFIVWANINIALPYNHNKYIITKPYDSLVGAFEIIRSSPVVTYQVGFVGLLTDVTNIYIITTEGSYGTLRKIDSNSFATVDSRLGSSAWWPIVDWALDKEYIYIIDGGSDLNRLNKNILDSIDSTTLKGSGVNSDFTPSTIVNDNDSFYFPGNAPGNGSITEPTGINIPYDPLPPLPFPQSEAQYVSKARLLTMNKDMTGKVYNKLDITHVDGITVKAETFYRGTIDDLYIYFGYREYVTTAGWNGDWSWGVPVIVYNTVIYEYIVKCYRVSPGIYTIVSSKPSNFDGKFVSDHNYIYCPNTLISDNKAGVWEKNFSLKYSAYLDAVYQTSLSVAATHEFKLL